MSAAETTLEAVADFLARLGDAEARVVDLEQAMAAQKQYTGRVAALTVRAHKKAEADRSRLLQGLPAA